MKNDNFWTDELVKEHRNQYLHQMVNRLTPTTIEDFKKSKTPTPQPKERECIKVWVERVSNDRMGATVYFNQPIPQDKFPAIKEAIEHILNGEHICKYCHAWNTEPDEQCYKAPSSSLKEDKPKVGKLDMDSFHQGYRIGYRDGQKYQQPTEDKTKEWEICAVRDSFGRVWYTDLPPREREGEKIEAVKRLSDGEVFTVGDIITWGFPKGFIAELTAFDVIDGRLKFYDSKLPHGRKPTDFINALKLSKA